MSKEEKTFLDELRKSLPWNWISINITMQFSNGMTAEGEISRAFAPGLSFWDLPKNGELSEFIFALLDASKDHPKGPIYVLMGETRILGRIRRC